MNEQPADLNRPGIFSFPQVSNCPWLGKHFGLFNPPNSIILQPPLRLTAMVMGDDQGKGHTKSTLVLPQRPERAIRIKYILLRIFGPIPHEKNAELDPAREADGALEGRAAVGAERRGGLKHRARGSHREPRRFVAAMAAMAASKISPKSAVGADSSFLRSRQRRHRRH